MAQPKGYILDRFASPLDGAPLVAILTLKSANRKTGNMAQVWILREDVSPVDAINWGLDYSICGNCPHRKNPETGVRTCYVNAGQAPSSVWKAYKKGLYLQSQTKAIRAIVGRGIRWGAYGDPALLNPFMVKLFNSFASSHTGYTHQWREEFAAEFRGIFMASCDNFADYLEATAHGWRTFAVAPVGSTLPGKLCPATIENSAATCQTCKLCNGAKVDIFVEAHGPAARKVGAL